MKTIKMLGLLTVLAGALSGCADDLGLMNATTNVGSQREESREQSREESRHDNGRHEGERRGRHRGDREDDD